MPRQRAPPAPLPRTLDEIMRVLNVSQEVAQLMLDLDLEPR